MRRYTLEIVVFICGAAVMILELVGARILAPYVGASMYVWASLIGVILGSLSLGYWWGGKLADKRATDEILSFIVVVAAVVILVVGMAKDGILGAILENIPDIRWAALVATLVLFAPATVLLGMVSPYAIKLKMKDLATAGKTAGNLYAISTVGSIMGTFLTGFVLLVYIGNSNILFVLSVSLLAASLVTYGNSRFKKSLLVLVVGLTVINFLSTLRQTPGNIDLDTQYNRVRIVDMIDPPTGRLVRNLMTDVSGVQSGMFLDGGRDLVYPYSKFYRLDSYFNPSLKNGLMIGGGAYSYPKEFLSKFPAARLDVVEIDPAMTRLARQYFQLPTDPRLVIHHEDGRVFLNQTAAQYDVVYIDAFRSFFSVPYQLTTKEAVKEIYNDLNENGVVLVNIVSAIEGTGGEFLRAEYATYQSVFPLVYIFPVHEPNNGRKVQNIMLVALKQNQPPVFSSEDKEINDYLQHRWQPPVINDIPILTDDRAPVDYYLMKTI